MSIYIWGWFWDSFQGSDFIHAERKYTCKCPWTPAFPLQIWKPCKAYVDYVYVVMAIQSQKSVSICGQPVCALQNHPANLNIWMMTQEAWSTLVNQSFPICHSDKVSSVPEDRSVRLEPNTRRMVHLFYNKLVFFQSFNYILLEINESSCMQTSDL